MSVAYQTLYINTHTFADGTRVYPGNITTNTVFMNFDYGLTDRWAINVGLPYRSGKFEGPGRHDPGNLDHNHGENLSDDGKFHSGWQDWSLGLRYQWLSKPWRVTPFVLAGAPSRDYNTFAHSAVGSGQWRLELGVNAARQFAPPLQNLYFRGGYSYAFMEPVDRRVNHSTFNLELGYFLTPRLSTRLLVSAQKTHNGFDFPNDFANFTDDHFYHHDQNLRNDFVNIGVGLNYQFNDRYQLFGNYGQTVWGENTHLIKYVATVGVTRSF